MLLFQIFIKISAFLLTLNLLNSLIKLFHYTLNTVHYQFWEYQVI